MPPDVNTERVYLEDLKPGDEFRSAEHHLDADQIVSFARQFDPQPFHLDEATAKNTFFGGLAASGWHTASITMGLLVESLPFARGVIGAGCELSWPRAQRQGDKQIGSAWSRERVSKYVSILEVAGSLTTE